MFDPFDLGDDSRVGDAPRLRLSLRIRGDSLDPDFLTQQLGVAPTSSAQPGDDGTRGGAWTYELEAYPDTDLGDALDQLLALFPQDATLWEELASSYTVDILCVVSLEGASQRTSLAAEAVQRLARLGLGIHLDFLDTSR
jgi:hypothetical protein